LALTVNGKYPSSKTPGCRATRFLSFRGVGVADGDTLNFASVGLGSKANNPKENAAMIAANAARFTIFILSPISLKDVIPKMPLV